MRNRPPLLGVVLALALAASACATDVVALRPEVTSVPQGSLVAVLDSAPPATDCALVHRHANKARAPGDSTEFSLDAFVSALPPPKRYELVRTLWEAHQRSGGDARVSALLRRTLSFLLRDEFCQVSS